MTKIVKQLIAAGANINSIIYDQYIIHHAASIGNMDILTQLVDAGADVDAVEKYFKLTTLQSAIVSGKPEVIKYLCEAGVEVNKTNKAGRTALHFACITKQAEMVKYLLAAGADPTIKDIAGDRAIDLTNDPEIKKLID